MTVTPRFFYTRQLPWRGATAEDFVPDFRDVNDRLRVGTDIDVGVPRA